MKTNRDRSRLSRRDFLTTTAASLAAAGIVGSGCKDGLMSGFGKREIPVGVQSKQRQYP